MPHIGKERKAIGEAGLSRFVLELIEGIDNGWLSIIKQDNVVIQINTNARIQLNEVPHLREGTHSDEGSELRKASGLDKAV